MTEAEWLQSNDAGAMLEFLWQSQGVPPSGIDLRFGGSIQESPPSQDIAILDRQLHRFYVASCRAIWTLLPQDQSRMGVEVAEDYFAGKATSEDLDRINWFVEGAAFNIDYNVDPQAIEGWVEQVRVMPEAELRSMLQPPETALELEPRELLKRAAYFVDFAMIYPGLTPKGPAPKIYYPFLSAGLLREFVGNPFHREGR